MIIQDFIRVSCQVGASGQRSKAAWDRCFNASSTDKVGSPILALQMPSGDPK